MATIQEVARQLDSARRLLRDLQSELELVNSEIFSLRRQLAQAQASGNTAAFNALQQQVESLRDRRDGLQAQIQTTENQISQLNTSLLQLQTQQRAAARGTDSAGQIVKEDSGESRTGSALETPPQVISPDGRIQNADRDPSGTNAVIPATGAVSQDVGTNAPVTPLNQSQATSSTVNQGSALPATRPEVSATSSAIPVQAPGQPPGGAPGAAATGDDAVSSNPTQQEIEARFGDQFFGPQPNILDRYASYTYNAEWHLVTPDQLRTLQLSQGDLQLTNTLLVRSGGAQAQASTNDSRLGQFGSRVQPFDLDFYLDDIVIENVLLGKGTGSSHSYASISFRVIEPLGLTFLDRLFEAVNVIAKIQSPAAALYAMVITFYGYDEDGNLVRVGEPASGGDPYAIVKKVIPFNIQDIKFVVENGPTIYQVAGVGTSFQSVHVTRGSVPYPIEIRGSTVGEILGEKAGGQTTEAAQQRSEVASDTGAQEAPSSVPPPSRDIPTDTGAQDIPVVASNSTSAPPKADAAVRLSDSVASNLMDALNQIQAKLVKDGIYEIADRYSIEFVEESIRSARLRKNLTPDYSKTPMTDPSNSRSRLNETQSADFERRILNIAPGTQIISVIDQVIRNSSYVADQSVIQYDEVTDQYRTNTTNGNRSVAWFKVNLVSSPIGNTLDKKRNDYAYDMKFVVSFYEVQGMDSTYFPTGRVTVLHKSYPYWFTGQNTAVLDYRQTYNFAYTTTISGALQATREQNFTDAEKLRKYAFAPRSSQSAQGAANRTNEPSSNASEFLYDPSALADSTMRILGDPAWLLQGETYRGVSASDFNYAPFLRDGTINSERGEVLYEIRWQKSQDYNLQTGLMDVGPSQPGSQNNNVQSLIYKASKAISEFRAGKFEQTLKGVLFQFPVQSPPNASNAQATDQENVNSPDLTRINATAASAAGTGPSAVVSPAVTPSTTQSTTLAAEPASSTVTPSASSLSAAALTATNAPSPPTSNADITPRGSDQFAAVRDSIINNADPQIMNKET